MTETCVCGHHSHDHASDPTHSGNTPCWASLDGRTDSDGYPVRRCQCPEFQPVPAQRTITVYHLDGTTGEVLDGPTHTLLYCTSGALLRAACKGEGLPVSGTNEAKARRLIAAGHDPATILDKYHWRNRREATDTG